MPTFTAPDGTRLAYHEPDGGDRFVAVPGGPMLDSAYLTGFPVPLLRLDLRGTGGSATPADPGGYRCDRQVDDLEALRVRLGRERLALLAHSAGAAIAVLYAARHPGRVERLALVNPSPRVVDLPISDEERRAAAEGQRGQEWFPEAFAALERIQAGAATDADWAAISPFTYGRRFQETAERNDEAAAAYYGDGAFRAEEVRAALAGLDAPVLIISGACDLQLPPAAASAYGKLFPRAEVAVLAGGSHFAWFDDPAWVARVLA